MFSTAELYRTKGKVILKLEYNKLYNNVHKQQAPTRNVCIFTHRRINCSLNCPKQQGTSLLLSWEGFCV